MKTKSNKKNILLKYAICFGCTLSFLNTYSYADDTKLLNQSVIKSFVGSSSDAFEGVSKTSDGGLVAVGYSSSTDSGLKNLGGTDAIIIKYDKNGEKKWAQSQGGSGTDYYKKVIELSDGSLIAVGYSNSTDGDFTNKGSYDAVVVKYDKNGNQLWVKNFGGSGNDYFYNITGTKDNGFIVVGNSNSTNMEISNGGGTDAIIVKYDSNGNQVWSKSISGSSNESLNSVIEMKNKDILIAGNSNSSNIGITTSGGNDAILARYDSDGNQKWIVNYGGSGADYFYSTVESSDESIFAVGYSNSTNLENTNLGGNDGILVKYNKDGSKIWSKNIGGNSVDYLYSMTETKDKSVVVVGVSNSSTAGFTNVGGVYGLMAKYNVNGEQEWIKGLGDSNSTYFLSVIEDSRYNIVAVGHSSSAFIDNKKGSSEAILVKCGDYYSAYKDIISPIIDMNVNINDTDNIADIKSTKDGGYIVAGYSRSTNLGFTNKGRDDAFLIKYDSSWKQEWISSFGGSSYDYFRSVVELSDGSFIAVGDSSSSDAGFNRIDSESSIIVKYNSNGIQQWVKALTSSVNESINHVIETSDGGVVMACQSSFVDDEHTFVGLKAILRKYDKDGNEEWARVFGNYRDNIYKSVTLTKDEGFLVVGSSQSSIGFTNAGGLDAIIVKYDKNGNQEWIKSYGTSMADCYYSVILASDNTFVAVGTADSNGDNVADTLISKYNEDGSIVWSKIITGNKDAGFYSVIEGPNGDLFTIGYTASTNIGFENKGLTDSILVKYDRDGNQEWIKSYGGNDSDYMRTIIYDKEKLFVSGYSYSTDIDFVNHGESDGVILQYDVNGNKLSTKTLKVKNINNTKNLEYIRGIVNSLTDEELKSYLNTKIDCTTLGFGGIELKDSSANLDVYIKSENMLLLSLSTNQITFEDFSGVSDMLKDDAVEISINSSLPYNLNAYLVTEIQNSDKTNTMEKEILQLKEDSEVNYQYFNNINEKMILKNNCEAGNDKVHLIDFKLKGGLAFEKDIYKTVVKFEVEQI